MGIFKKKIDRFANSLVNNFCLGNKKYINKNHIRTDLCEIIFKFLVAKFEESLEKDIDFSELIISNLSVLDLVTQIQYPLLAVENKYIGDKTGIDLSINNMDYKIIKSCQNFFVEHGDSIKKHIKPVVAKKINKVVKKEEEMEKNSMLDKTDINTIGTFESITDTESIEEDDEEFKFTV